MADVGEGVSSPALVLAGGRATRMGGVDKCHLPLADGRPILAHLLEALLAAELHPILLDRGEPVPEWVDPRVVRLPPREQFGGTARALADARSYLNHRKPAPIVVVYGDTFLPGFDYGSVAAQARMMTLASKDAVASEIGNVTINDFGGWYIADERDHTGRFVEASAFSLRWADLAYVGEVGSLPLWLHKVSPWTKLVFHGGEVLTTGDPDSYERAKGWRP